MPPKGQQAPGLKCTDNSDLLQQKVTKQERNNLSGLPNVYMQYALTYHCSEL